MCNAIYAAAVLAALVVGLTVLRVREGRSPNAELIADLLEETGGTARPARRDSGRKTDCPPAAHRTAESSC
jgi:hypothetical protein